MRNLILTLSGIVALLSLSSCQRSVDDVPADTPPPAMLNSVIEVYGKKFVLTQMEAINEKYPDGNRTLGFSYDAKGAMIAFQEYYPGGLSGTASFSYTHEKVDWKITPVGSDWEDRGYYSLSSSGWPKSNSAKSYEDGVVVYRSEDSYTLNPEDRVAQETYSYSELLNGEPIYTRSGGEKHYFEDGNLIRTERYSEDSSPMEAVYEFEYDASKTNLLKSVALYDGEFSVIYKKPSRNLVSRFVYKLVGPSDGIEYEVYRIDYTYTFNANGLPTEIVATQTYKDTAIEGETIMYRFTYSPF